MKMINFASYETIEIFLTDECRGGITAADGSDSFHGQ